MPTGACGVNCDVCKLRCLEVCSSCGPGNGLEAEKKLEAQERIFGTTCAILACACMNNLEYCMRDCDSFPCDNFRVGPYPFSEGFLDMQERRRQQKDQAKPDANRISVPLEYWDELKKRDMNMLCNFTLATPHPPQGLVFHFLQEDVQVDVENRCLKRLSSAGQWEETDTSLLELVTLVYLNTVEAFHPLTRDIVGAKDLKEGHFFKGPHELKVAPLLDRYGNDLQGFRKAADCLEGEPLDMADVAYKFLPFPRIPLYYLLWEGDEEFAPRISVLFDRSIERSLPADAIWGLVTLVSDALLRGQK